MDVGQHYCMAICTYPEKPCSAIDGVHVQLLELLTGNELWNKQIEVTDITLPASGAKGTPTCSGAEGTPTCAW